MATYIPPVPLPDLQRYLKDTSTDAQLLVLLQFALETATERVYTYLGRDYTPSAVKTDIFWGNNTDYHYLRYPCGAITSWEYYDREGTVIVGNINDLHLFQTGMVVINAEDVFKSHYEHRITYTQPALIVAPELVKQVIIELAAQIFEESKHGAGALGIASDWNRDDAASDRVRYLDLSDRHRAQLSAYRRISI